MTWSKWLIALMWTMYSGTLKATPIHLNKWYPSVIRWLLCMFFILRFSSLWWYFCIQGNYVRTVRRNGINWDFLSSDMSKLALHSIIRRIKSVWETQTEIDSIYSLLCDVIIAEMESSILWFDSFQTILECRTAWTLEYPAWKWKKQPKNKTKKHTKKRLQCGVLGQVYYLIVSIPYLYLLAYFELQW